MNSELKIGYYFKNLKSLSCSIFIFYIFSLHHIPAKKKARPTNEECLKITLKSFLVFENMHIIEGIHHAFYRSG